MAEGGPVNLLIAGRQREARAGTIEPDGPKGLTVELRLEEIEPA